MRPQCTERGWYKDPSNNWRFRSPDKAGSVVMAGMGAHTLGVYGGDGVIYWICDQCRNVPPSTGCSSWPGLYARPVDPVAEAFWVSYYLEPNAPSKIKAHGHDGDPATFQQHFPQGHQSYALYTIDEITPVGQRVAFKRAYDCEVPVPPPIELSTFCPRDFVSRQHMAVFLLKTKHGADYAPPPATGTMFSDVPITHPYAAWIEQLAREGITAGKSPCEAP